MLHTLQKKIQRVSELITEYDDDEDRYRNPNPALQDFIQKLKVILNGENESTRNDETDYSNLISNRTNNVSPSSSSSPPLHVDGSNINPKVIEAFGNHAVLTEIFKFGNFRDLRSFRLINMQWKGIANSAIIQRRLWKLSVKEMYRAINSNRNIALSELNDCIEASGGSFPLTTLDFSDVKDLKCFTSPALLRFYTLMGPSIKHVIFHNFGPLTMNEFQDLLVKNLPNVDHIDAGKIFFTNRKKWQLELLLPYLKTIRFVHAKPDLNVPYKVLRYYKGLFLAATNLKKISDFPIQLTNIIIETGKIGCIKKFNVAVENLLGLINYCFPLHAKFSYTEPKLTSVNITRRPFSPDENFKFYPELVSSLQRILISSKDTLKYFQCVPHFFPVDFQFPKFPNLEFLTFIDNNDWYGDAVGPPCVFPSRCDCSENFGNVHTVSLDVFLDRYDTLFKYFLNQVFPSVKTVEFQANFQFGRSLKTNFPNVSHIKIIDFERMISNVEEEEPLNEAFRINQLNHQIESLEFHQCLLARAGEQYCLDSLITGIPARAVPDLLEMHKSWKTRGEDDNTVFDKVKGILKALQTKQYAFRNSEGLRRIKIIFNHSENAFFPMFNDADSLSDSEYGSGNEEIDLLTPIISLVSCAYGFSLMPNLEQVIIGYDHYLPNASDIAEVFEPFAQFPYVKIIHEPTIIRSLRND